MPIDINANSLDRVRRNWQAASKGALTAYTSTTAPITGGNAIGLSFLTSTGLGLTNNALALLFSDASIAGSSTGIHVVLMPGGGLETSTNGIGISTGLSTTAPLAGGGNLSTGLTLSMPQAGSTANGWLSSTDWNKFNSTGGGGGSTAIIAADASILVGTSTGSTTLRAKYGASGSTLLSTGSDGIDLVSVASTLVFAGPSTGANAVPGFRALTNNDLPVLSSTKLPSDVAYTDVSNTFTSTQIITVNDSTNTQVEGFEMDITLSGSVWVTNATGMAVFPTTSGTGNVTNLYGADVSVDVAGTGSTLNVFGYHAYLEFDSGSTNNAYGLKVDSIANFANLNNAYGIYIADQSGQGSLISHNLHSAGTASMNLFEGIVSVGQGLILSPQSDPGSPSNGELWYNSTAAGFRARDNGATVGGVWSYYVNTANSAAVTNTTTSTITLSTAPLPANFFTAGRALRVHFHGFYSASTSGQGTLNIGVFLIPNGGGSTIALDGNPTYTPAAGAGGAQFMGDLMIQCRSTGSTGQLYTTGLEFFNAASVTFGPVDNFGVTVDTTKSYSVAVAVKWSVASSANTTTTDVLTVEIIDPP